MINFNLAKKEHVAEDKHSPENVLSIALSLLEKSQ